MANIDQYVMTDDATNSDEEELEDSEDESNDMYLSCLMQGRRLGMACYDGRTRQLQAMETWEDPAGEDFPSLQLLKFQLQPAIIYAPSKTDDCFLAALKQPVTPDGPDFSVKLMKSSMFSYEQAKHRLSYAQWEDMPEGLTDRQRIQLIMSMINFDNDVQVRAAGGLVAILQEEFILDRFDAGDENSGKFMVRLEGISQLQLEEYLTIDASTYDALQIFQLEKHASSMGIGTTKEGFSVFGVLNKCVTQGGRRLLKLWFLRPLVQLDVIQDRQATISFFKAFPDLMKLLLVSLKHIKDLPKLLVKLGSANMLTAKNDWHQLQESTAHLLQIHELFELGIAQCENPSTWCELRILKKVLESINSDVAHVRDLITGVIDFDQTCGESTETLIATGICSELDELKGLYEGIPDFLNQVTASELATWPETILERETIKHSTIRYIPQVGYLLRVEGTRDELDFVETLPDINFAFEGDDDLGHGSFYNTAKTKELDTVLGDVFHKILDMESALLRDLENRVLEHKKILCKAAGVVAEVDCLISLALCARENNYVRPNLTKNNVLQVKNGRHMLQEMTVNTFVPNDTNITNTDVDVFTNADWNYANDNAAVSWVKEGQGELKHSGTNGLHDSNGRICVITGPNYSGKSIYAKQVALVVFLAHIGSFVPADDATIGITDRIFTRVASRESTSASQSTFMIDLKQMSSMLRHATSRSLCIVDEFGKGTLTADGLGLLCASLTHVGAMPAPPKMLVCTHFCEVMDTLTLTQSKKIAFYTMSVLEPARQKQVNAETKSSNQKPYDDIVFLYRLVPGRAKESFGVHCAELAGVPCEVVNRAKEIAKHIKEGTPIQRLRSPLLTAKDEMYKGLVTKLLAFDCSKGDIQKFVREVCGTGDSTDQLLNAEV